MYRIFYFRLRIVRVGKKENLVKIRYKAREKKIAQRRRLSPYLRFPAELLSFNFTPVCDDNAATSRRAVIVTRDAILPSANRFVSYFYLFFFSRDRKKKKEKSIAPLWITIKCIQTMVYTLMYELLRVYTYVRGRLSRTLILVLYNTMQFSYNKSTRIRCEK